jgi:hypothetical protein
MRSRAFALLRRQPIALPPPFVALGGTSSAPAQASGDGRGNTVHGCVGEGSGRLRIVDAAARCSSRETAISLNREGRRGPQGLNRRDGAAGLSARAASAGDNCAAGESAIIAGQDADRNGRLGGPEVNAALTCSVCNGTSGAAETAADALDKIESADGSGSGLDADTLDGLDSSSFVTRGAFDSLFSGQFDACTRV